MAEGGDSWNQKLRIAETGPAKRSAFSFNNHAGIPSGPCALEGLSADSFIKVENSDNHIYGMAFVVGLWWVKRIVGRRLKNLHWGQER